MADRIFNMMREHLDDKTGEQFELAACRKRPPKWTKYFTPLTTELLEQVYRERETTRLAATEPLRNASASNGDNANAPPPNGADLLSAASISARMDQSLAGASPLPPTKQQRRKPIPMVPNADLESGKKLPSDLARLFPQHKLAGIPLMDLDDYYRDKMVCLVYLFIYFVEALYSL